MKTSQVPQVFSNGDIFLNLSITEAFCLANLEAISSGIYVVSTDVGGVAEVLPPDHLCLVEPEINSLIKSLGKIIKNE